ncbi:transmembrane ascorbate-dependent reductase CYB561-like isoform X5 [Panulirus ornatus]|uniref:transmembrane ascorbate-dependent reductase CYB561-like isoform X5 n=1 Tax=Panulirus ornatus TaxID=150431 RepID=UPI003A895A55
MSANSAFTPIYLAMVDKDNVPLTSSGFYDYEDDDDDEQIEYDSCRIKRDWEAGEGGSLIGRGVLDEMENEAQHIPFFTKLFTLTQVVGALIYRGFRFEKKKKLKILHMVMQLGAFILSIVGLVAVFDFHNRSDIPNMYSLHSWIGLSTVILFACQWLAGLLTFLFPGLRPSVRAAYLPVHQFFGLFIFVGAVVSCLLGLTEKIIFVKIGYSSLPPEGILVNVIGMVLVIFGGLVVYLTSNPKFRRQTTEDEVLLTDTVLE